MSWPAIRDMCIASYWATVTVCLVLGCLLALSVCLNALLGRKE